MSSLDPAPPPAGWYPDETGRRRWWDGSAWGPYAAEPGASSAQSPAAFIDPVPGPPAYPAQEPSPSGYAAPAPTPYARGAELARTVPSTGQHGALPYGALPYSTPIRPLKDVTVAYVFVLLLGGFGAHRFYLRRTGSAIAILILTVVGWTFNATLVGAIIGIPLVVAVVIWLIVDLFLIPGMVREENSRVGGLR